MINESMLENILKKWSTFELRPGVYLFGSREQTTKVTEKDKVLAKQELLTNFLRKLVHNMIRTPYFHRNNSRIYSIQSSTRFFIRKRFIRS